MTLTNFVLLIFNNQNLIRNMQMTFICVIRGIKSGRRRYPHSSTGNYRKSIETALHVLSLIIFLLKNHYHLSLPVWTSPFVILFLQVTSKNLTRFIYYSKEIQLFLTRYIFINILITTFISNSTLVPFLKVSSKDLTYFIRLNKGTRLWFQEGARKSMATNDSH